MDTDRFNQIESLMKERGGATCHEILLRAALRQIIAARIGIDPFELEEWAEWKHEQLKINRGTTLYGRPVNLDEPVKIPESHQFRPDTLTLLVDQWMTTGWSRDSFTTA